MKRDKRRYPISEELFTKAVLPIILDSYRGTAPPPNLSLSQVFCRIVYTANRLPLAGFTRGIRVLAWGI
jgi:hypothetical protein